jgi:hypothetical protein
LLLTGSRFPDLIVGSAIGVYVVKEAFEILSEAREARAGRRHRGVPATQCRGRG